MLILDQKGVTLIELVSVLAIISIVSLIIVPRFNNVIAKYELEAAARMIASDLRLAQQMAVSKGEYYRIIFDTTNKDRYQFVLATKIIKQVLLPEGVQIDSTSFDGNTVIFGHSGAPQPAGTITLIGRNGQFLFVIVAVATGRVRISEEPPEY